MRAVSAFTTGTRHIVGMVLQAVLIVAIVAALVIAAATAAGSAPGGADSVFAAKGGTAGANDGGGNGGGQSATITLMQPAAFAATAASWPAVGSNVSFAVDANVRARDLYSLWVGNECFQDGVKVYAEFQPVLSGGSGPFTLNWAGGAASCTAYVWLFPDTGHVLSGGTTSYAAGG